MSSGVDSLSRRRCTALCLVLGSLAWQATGQCAPEVGSDLLPADTHVDPPQTDPLFQSTGDRHRSYWFADAHEQSPYRIYVPTTWKAGKSMPLIVILHGANGDENSPFERAPEAQKGLLARLAETRGYIVVAINGMGGAWGSPLYFAKKPTGQALHPVPPHDPLLETSPRLMAEAVDPVRNGLSEKDVTNVILRTAAEYGVDRSRIYLMGNSMGCVGAFYLATKYPKLWRAVVPSDCRIEPGEYPYDRLGAKGFLIIGGALDPIVDTGIMHAFVRGIQAQGIEARYDEVPNGTHPTAWFMDLDNIFNFYDRMGQ